jgi:AcrR family transcriptional regulator
MRKVPPNLARKLVSSADSFATTFDDCRMDDIAQASGIPRATLYYYFAGKDEILAFLLDAMLADFSRRVEAAIEPIGDIRTRLATLIRVQLELLAASPAAAQVLVANLGRVGKLPDIGTAIDDALIAPISRLLAEGVRRGEVGDIDVRTIAGATYGAVTIAGLHAVVMEGTLDVRQLVDHLVNLVWNGIGTSSGAHRASRSVRGRR